MINTIPQTSGLMKFLNNIDLNKRTLVDIKGNEQGNRTSLNHNLLDENLQFVSRFYTPQLRLSPLADKVLELIKDDNIVVSDVDSNTHTIIKKVGSTILHIQAPQVYKILQSIVLEAYSIINCMTENIESLKYLSSMDLLIIRENINYVADYLSQHDNYDSIIEDLRSMDICFGYLEQQLPILKKELDIQ